MKNKFSIFIITLIATIGVISAGHSVKTYADFLPGRIIDDAIFSNVNSMDAAGIDNFLNSFPNSCISPNSGFRTIDPVGYSPSTGYRYGGYVTAGKAIFDAAQAYGLNPQVLIVTLQKEQSLVIGGAGYCNDGDEHKYAAAVGYGCPDGGTKYYYSDVNLYQRNGVTRSTVGPTCVNTATKAGFSQQIIRAAWLFKFGQQRSLGNADWAVVKPNWDNSDDLQSCYGGPMTAGTWRVCPSGQATYYDGYRTIDNTAVYIETGATAALYWYTPHFHGNQNFSALFNSWFGSTYAYTYGGINYSDVFDPNYYINAYPDIKASFGDNPIAAFDHFIRYGIDEGRQAKADFNVITYRNRYVDLRWMFGKNLKYYYHHYISNGKREGWVATGTATLVPVTSYKGVNYASVYDFNTYLAKNSDMQAKFANDDTGALVHFINYGMNEGRVASTNFSVSSYRNRYFDLRRSFGTNLQQYYLHYIGYGQAEGRIATGEYYGGTTVLNGVNYAAVYDFNTYRTTNNDIKSVFGVDDAAALQHFVNYGMNEGRIASATFNVNVYRQNYADLRQAYGSNLKLYYLHYMNYGKNEGRVAS